MELILLFSQICTDKVWSGQMGSNMQKDNKNIRTVEEPKFVCSRTIQDELQDIIH